MKWNDPGRAIAQPRTTTLKSTIGNYEIIDKIGAGAMSRVYLGCPKSLPGKRVAIKILDPALAMDGDFVARFKREAYAVSLLQHANVANIFDFGVDNEVHYLVMEYLQGSDLRKIMDDVSEIRGTPGLPVGSVLYLIEEMAHGLRSAHERGIIHRDIKPTNVLLGLEGEVKVVDFGLARSLDESSSLPLTEATMSGAFLGTAAYASPEQAAKEKNLDARSDVFSLGVLAYEMLTNRKPFMGHDLDTTLRMIIADPHAPLAESPCVPVFPELVSLIDGMLAKQRDRRLPDMAAVLEALQDCRQGLENLGIRYSNRRDHLARLARDPRAHCAKLHAEVAAIMGGPQLEDVGEQTIVPKLPPAASQEGTIVPQAPSGTRAPAAPPEQATAAEPAPRVAAPTPSPPSRPAARRRWPWLAGAGLLVVMSAVAMAVLGLGPFAADSPAARGWLQVTASVDGATLRYVEAQGGTGGDPLDRSGVQTVTVGQRATVVELGAGNWFGEASRDGYAAHGQYWTVAAAETVVARFDLFQQGVEPASLYLYAGDPRFNGARIYIDGTLRPERLPALIEKLASGFHELRLEVEVDGVPYSKTLEIELLPGMADRRLIRFDD